MKSRSEIIKEGLWHNNAALVQLLGLCPLLAVSNSVVNALGLGLATTFVLTGSNTLVSLSRNLVTREIRVPVFVMIIAILVTSVELIMQALTYELYQALGLFVALIVTNCVILGRAEGFAAKSSVGLSALDGFMQGLGFSVVLLLLGAARELVGQGTLFANMDLLLGPIASNWALSVSTVYPGFLLAVLPPGAFIALGFLIAVKNIIDARLKKQVKAVPVADLATESSQ